VELIKRRRKGCTRADFLIVDENGGVAMAKGVGEKDKEFSYWRRTIVRVVVIIIVDIQVQLSLQAHPESKECLQLSFFYYC